jgi:hypothetical protein
MYLVISIPKGKNILDFLQELGVVQNLAGNACHFMHRNVVEELIRQLSLKELSPAITLLASGDYYSFTLHYGSPQQHVGAIVLRSEPCYDANHRALWFIVTNLYLFENSPIQIAFRHPSAHPSKAIFLALEKE